MLNKLFVCRPYTSSKRLTFQKKKKINIPERNQVCPSSKALLPFPPLVFCAVSGTKENGATAGIYNPIYVVSLIPDRHI